MSGATTRTVQWMPNPGQWNAFDWETGMLTHEGVAALLRTPYGARMQLALTQSVLKAAIEVGANQLFRRAVLAQITNITNHHLAVAHLKAMQKQIKGRRKMVTERRKHWLGTRSASEWRFKQERQDEHLTRSRRHSHAQMQDLLDDELMRQLRSDRLPELNMAPNKLAVPPLEEAAYVAELVGFEASLAVMTLLILGLQWRLARPQVERLYQFLTQAQAAQSPQDRARRESNRPIPPCNGDQPPPFVYQLNHDPTYVVTSTAPPWSGSAGTTNELDPLSMGPEAVRNLSRMADNPQLMRMVEDFEARRVPMAQRVFAGRHQVQSEIEMSRRYQWGYNPGLFVGRPTPRPGIARRPVYQEELNTSMATMRMV